jgi:hypothetical protein
MLNRARFSESQIHGMISALSFAQCTKCRSRNVKEVSPEIDGKEETHATIREALKSIEQLLRLCQNIVVPK